jgi:hypothetical protein
LLEVLIKEGAEALAVRQEEFRPVLLLLQAVSLLVDLEASIQVEVTLRPQVILRVNQALD